VSRLFSASEVIGNLLAGWDFVDGSDGSQIGFVLPISPNKEFNCYFLFNFRLQIPKPTLPADLHRSAYQRPEFKTPRRSPAVRTCLWRLVINNQQPYARFDAGE
jgi:hypothetical protein